MSIADRELECDARISASGVYVVSEYGEAAPPENAPEGSIAIISLSGVVTKYDQGSRGTAGTITKNDLLARALANPNITGVILLMDSPGGQAGAGERMVQTIRKADKPVIGVIDGMACSAMYEIAAACTEIYCVDQMSKAGSVGTFVTVADYSKQLEQMGIKLLELYATDSTQKNIEVREALAGKPEKLQAYVDEINAIFLASVKESRGEKITDPDAYKGKAYTAKAAEAAGLIDGIATMDQVIGLMDSKISISKSIQNQTTFLI
ncbi:MAG: S49 family peptidase [Oceanospirillaceae bacterium]|nr:S49 family peptidase [Oceanospirillaceae bacterium]